MRVSLKEGEVAMYLSDKPTPIDFYKEEGGRDMMAEIVGTIPPQQQQQMMLGESSGEDHELKAPKKRAETWVHEETRCLISLRIEMDSLFNVSKSNKHLWEQISSRMREKGFDRSPTMCTDKWRNLLKDYKKTRNQDRGISASAKISYFKELEELLRERKKNTPSKSPTPPRVDPFIQFTDKGLEDANIPFGPAEEFEPGSLRPAGERPNLERRSDHDGQPGVPLALTAADAAAATGVPPWNWRDTTPGSGGDSNSYGGRIITVKWGDFTRRIGIDGTADAIKEAIKSAFGLRSKRAFWLEDEDEVIRSFDRDMPLGTYTLHLDEGITIKICLYDESNRILVRHEEKTLYTEDDFRDLLRHRGWIGLRELSGFIVDTLEELRPGAMYQGVNAG